LLPAVTVPVRARDRVQWVAGEQALLPPLAARARVQLVHSLASTAPLWGPFRRVATVHDLIYERFPDAHAGIRDRGMRLLVPAAARRSARVIADSQSTREDILRWIGLPPELVDVVPLGLGTPQRAEPEPESEVRARLELGSRPILLTLSAKRPHKNLSALIGALGRIPRERRPLLVMPGYPTAYEAELRGRAEELGMREDVRFPAWIAEGELERLWLMARAFVFPSLYEGFGLPVLEAMARGVPVACSNASSLPEVAGDAALLFDPSSEPAIAEAIERLLGDEALRASLRDRGLARAAEFSWERTARLTLAVYERALGIAPARSGAEPDESPA
jgi:glycosyltransferase involved in cell wall biosynthesis